MAIIGAAGYTGQETLDRVLAHPELELVALGSDTLAGQPASALDPRLARNGASRAPAFVTNDAGARERAQSSSSSASTTTRAASFEPPAEGVVVDLTGAHRLRDSALYAEWYGFEHPRPDGLASWCYALPELWPPTGRLIANPGCYATAALLALGPLAGVVDHGSVVVDAKSGVSGAGRSPKPGSHAGFVLENLSAYKVGSHQHEPEIAQALGFPVCFVPHLLPIRRGLVATCYVRGIAAGAVRELLEAAYADSPAVSVLPAGRHAGARPRPGHRRRRARRLRRPRDRPRDRDLGDRQPRQGRRGPGRPEREPRARPAPGRWPSPRGGAGVSVTAARGFVASGIHAGMRRSSRDLAVVCSTVPSTGSAMFTVNRVQAAPVVVSRAHLEAAEPRAVIANSGSANAATGKRGGARRARDHRRGRPPARAARRGGARALDRRDRHAGSRSSGCSPGCETPCRRSRPTVATTRPRRS